jgi:TldD protein
MLVDFQTTREQAAWLAPYYQKRNMPVRSHGCAGSQSALFTVTQRSPNVRMHPAATEVSFDDMVKDTKRGVAVMAVNVQIDQQQLTGVGHSIMREIKDGKLGRYLPNAGFLFRSPELWKSLVAIGGPSTSEWFGSGRRRGQPAQGNYHSVGAVPAKLSNLAVIDVTRKA